MVAPHILAAMAALVLASAAHADWDLRVRITCPGASVFDLTERVVLPAERVARNVTGVKQVDTVSRPELLTMTLHIAGDGSDRRAVRLDVQHQLEANLKHMSVDIEKIEVEDIYERVYPRIVAVSGKGTSLRILKRQAKWLRDEIQCCPNVSGVKMLGDEEYVIAMLIQKGHLALSCSISELAEMLSGYMTLESAGAINVGSRRLRIAAENTLKTGEDVTDLPFTINPQADGKGETVMLRDHVKMEIQRSTTPPESMTGVDGERCIFLAVSFREDMSDSELDKVIAHAKEEAPLGLEIETVYDGIEHGKDRTLLFDLSMVEGVRIEATDECLRALAKELRKVAGVERVLTVAGAADIVMVSGQKIEVPAPNKGLLVLELTKSTSQADICRRVQECAAENCPAAIVVPRCRVENDGYGVCHAEAVSSRYDGCGVQHRVEKMLAVARAVPGVRLAYSEWGDPVEFLRFSLYNSRARQLCITRSTVSLSCRTLLEGYPVTDFWFMGERLPVVLRVGANDGNVDVQKLPTMWTYSSALNQFIPFGQVVRDFKSCSEIGCAVRRNGVFVDTVFVWADSGEAIEAVKKVWADIK